MFTFIMPFLAFFTLNSTPSAIHFPSQKQLATHEMSLDKRYNNQFVNGVFKDNILLNIAYLDGKVHGAKDINWKDIEKPLRYEFTLKPGESFAFHDSVLPQYQSKISLTTNAHFNSDEGFKSDGYLVGDGVCHFASLINWVARDANLDVNAPTNHNFAIIPEVPKEYGVAIFDQKNDPSASSEQNLYITNNHNNPVKFVFDYRNDILKIIAEEIQ